MIRKQLDIIRGLSWPEFAVVMLYYMWILDNVFF